MKRLFLVLAAASTLAFPVALKVLIDQVLSHSSDQHAWFRESRTSRTNPKADWYVWADARPDGTPPNNWQSVFGGSMWTRVTEADGSPGQWYLHLFAPEQPDLNYRNPLVVEAMKGVIRFWLGRGVAGTFNATGPRQPLARVPLSLHQLLFRLGVASGHPTTQSVVLWTRLLAFLLKSSR